MEGYADPYIAEDWCMMAGVNTLSLTHTHTHTHTHIVIFTLLYVLSLQTKESALFLHWTYTNILFSPPSKPFPPSLHLFLPLTHTQTHPPSLFLSLHYLHLCFPPLRSPSILPSFTPSLISLQFSSIP